MRKRECERECACGEEREQEEGVGTERSCTEIPLSALDVDRAKHDGTDFS